MFSSVRHGIGYECVHIQFSSTWNRLWMCTCSVRHGDPWLRTCSVQFHMLIHLCLSVHVQFSSKGNRLWLGVHVQFTSAKYLWLCECSVQVEIVPMTVCIHSSSVQDRINYNCVHVQFSSARYKLCVHVQFRSTGWSTIACMFTSVPHGIDLSARESP